MSPIYKLRIVFCYYLLLFVTLCYFVLLCSTLVQSPEFTTVSGRRMRGGARGGGVVSFSPSAVNADFGVDPRALSLAMSDEVRSNSAKRLQQAEFNRSQIRTNKQINSRNWNDKVISR